MKKKPSPTGAAAYARMSAKHQSIGDQMKAIRKYAKRRGLEIENEYSDGAKQPTER
jgi:DNA invertase Pin-like site-specific DNA recombinase